MVPEIRTETWDCVRRTIVQVRVVADLCALNTVVCFIKQNQVY